MCRAFLSVASLLLCLHVLSLGSGCEWQPTAKPVQPQLMLAGPVKVDRLIDPVATQRFVLLTRDPASTTGGSRRAIFERATKKVCDLPAGTVQIDGALFDRAAKEAGPAFMLPIIVNDGAEDRALYYSDEHCVLRGPFGRARVTNAIALDGSGQEVSAVGDGRGTLTLVNPWTEQVTTIATGVSAFANVRRPTTGESPVGAQAFWLLENGALTQRTLTGELLFSRGQDVRDFTQALFNTLRVAYVDGTTLYEAAGPDFQPVAIAHDACEPNYSGLSLNLFTPCDDRQLVRIDLTNGQAQTFVAGTFAAYSQSGFLFEHLYGPGGEKQFYVTPPGGARTLVTPTFELNTVQVLDNNRIVGTAKNERLGNDFVLWDARLDSTVHLFSNVGRAIPFLNMRASEVLWLFQHDVADRRGTLSLFSQRSLLPETLAMNVPTTAYSVEVLAQVSEPALVFIEDAEPVSDTDNRLNGSLHARLVSGELGAVVDHNVTSYVAVYTPLEGLVYSVEDGERSGLWFAAL